MNSDETISFCGACQGRYELLVSYRMRCYGIINAVQMIVHDGVEIQSHNILQVDPGNKLVSAAHYSGKAKFQRFVEFFEGAAFKAQYNPCSEDDHFFAEAFHLLYTFFPGQAGSSKEIICGRITFCKG